MPQSDLLRPQMGLARSKSGPYSRIMEGAAKPWLSKKVGPRSSSTCKTVLMKSPLPSPTRLVLSSLLAMAGFFLLAILGAGVPGPDDPPEVQDREKWIGIMAVLGLLASALSLISGCVWGFCRWLGLQGKGHGRRKIEKSLT